MLPFFTWVYSWMVTIDPTLYIYIVVIGYSCYVVTSVQLAAHHYLGNLDVINTEIQVELADNVKSFDGSSC